MNKAFAYLMSFFSSFYKKPMEWYETKPDALFLVYHNSSIS